MSAPHDLPTTLLGILDYLERNGWDCRLRSQAVKNGTRRYVGKVWKPDDLGGSYDQHDVDPARALTLALIDAKRKRTNRWKHLRQRQKRADAINARHATRNEVKP